MKKIALSIALISTYAFAEVTATDVEAKYTNKSAKIEATGKPVQSINLGFANTTGNAKTLNFNAKYSLTHMIDIANSNPFKYNFQTTGYLTKSAGIKTNEEYTALLNGEQNFHDGWLGFVALGWLRNEFRNYENKFSIVAGIGKTLFDDGKHKFIVKIGPAYNIEQYSNNQAEKSYGSINEYLEYDNKLNETSNLYVRVGALQNLEDVSNDYEVTGLFGVDFALGSGVSVSLEYEVMYDNLPPVGFKTTDTKSIARVGYKF